MKRIGRLLAPAALGFLPAACDESDAVAVRVRLEADFSGTVTASRVSLPAEAGALEGASQGVSWSDRVRLESSAGSFARLSEVRIEEISFACGETSDGMRYVEARLPRGGGVRWPKTMTVADPGDRRRAGKTFDPEGRARDFGAAIKIQIDLPAPPVAHGIIPDARRLQEDVEGKRVSVSVPVEAALQEGAPFVWQLTWRK